MEWIGGSTHKEREAAAKSKEGKLNSELKRFGFQIEQLGADPELLPYPYKRIGMIGVYADSKAEALEIFKQLLEDIATKLLGDSGIDIAQITDLSSLDDQL
jgi:hypothetical protein